MSCEECLSMEFSHNSEKKELEEQILGLQKKLKDSVSRETVLQMQKYSRAKNEAELIGKLHKIDSFIRLLDQYPMFWGKSYKKSIKQFLHDNQKGAYNKYDISLDFNYLDE